MESQPTPPVTETEKPKSKVEKILEKSHFACNFGGRSEEVDPAKDIFMVDLGSDYESDHSLPKLPKGFGFTGGAGRNAAMSLLSEKITPPRDIDIEGIWEMILNPDEIKKVSQEFPPGKNPSLVIVKRDLSEYFSTRDFTINEVFLYRNHLYFSRQALEDLESKTIRPTANESKDAWDWTEIDDKLRVKALLLQVDFIKQYNQSKIDSVNGRDWNLKEIPAFFLALGLERASQKDNQVAYLRSLLDTDTVSAEDIPRGATEEGVRELAAKIKHWLVNEGSGFEFTDAYFENAYKEVWRRDDEEKFQEKYRQSIGRAVTTHGISQEDLEND